jgi:hypothetical protein
VQRPRHRSRRLWLRLFALVVGLTLLPLVAAPAQEPLVRLREGRFTIVADRANATLARSLLQQAITTDTFPGLPRPTAAVTLVIAADARQFRDLIGPSVPEWGSAVAFPHEGRIVMQGRRAGSRAGDPFDVLRHELAHLVLHEALGDITPRWFDEGYASFAAREWSREDALRTNVALVIRGTPTLDELERWFGGGAARAEAAYALAYRAVAELAELDPHRGLTVLLAEWKRTGKLDTAVRNAYGLTLAGFEARWRARTRRRYGGLALLADVTLAAGFVLVVILPLYFARKRRDRRRMAVLVAADEAADRAARESALALILRPQPQNGGSPESEDGGAARGGETR